MRSDQGWRLGEPPGPTEGPARLRAVRHTKGFVSPMPPISESNVGDALRWCVLRLYNPLGDASNSLPKSARWVIVSGGRGKRSLIG